MKARNISISLWCAVALVFSSQLFGFSAVAVNPPNLAVQIGNNVIQFETIQPCADDASKFCINWLGQYIKAIFQYGIGLAAVLAVVMIMVAGFMWLTSGGSSDRVSRAKEIITSALTGLVLALLSFTLLYTINPRLVALEPLRVTKITETYITSQNVGCCVVGSPTASCVYFNEEVCAQAKGSFRGYGSSCASMPECATIIECHGPLTLNVPVDPDTQGGIDLSTGETKTITIPDDRGLACGGDGHCWDKQCIVCSGNQKYAESEQACRTMCQSTLNGYLGWAWGCCSCRL